MKRVVDLLDGALVQASMAKVQPGSKLGGMSSSRYSPGRTTVVGVDECNMQDWMQRTV